MTSDFGMLGGKPSNQKLLDYLAAEFLRSGWSVKQLHRTIMLSEAYQRSSGAGFQPAMNDKSSQASSLPHLASHTDPANDWYWRFDRPGSGRLQTGACCTAVRPLQYRAETR